MPSWFRRRPTPVQKDASLAEINSALSMRESAQSFAPENYGNYYFTSVPAYRAVQVRSDAVASARLVIGTETVSESGRAEFIPAGNENPVQDLLDRVNPWFTRGSLWRLTEAHLLLFGSAYWFLDSTAGIMTIWPLHPSRVRVIPGRGNNPLTGFIAGFEYQTEAGKAIPLGVDEVVPFWRMNPQDMYAGFSHVAPVRLSLDMGHDAIRYNRDTFKNGVLLNNLAFVVPGITTLPDEEIEAFYIKLKQRFSGPGNFQKPMLIPGGNSSGGSGVDVKNLGMTQKDMEFIASLNWTVQDAARAFGVPPPMLYSQDQSKYNNVHEWNSDFWRSTIMPEWDYLASVITERLLPIMKQEGMAARFDYGDSLAIQESLTLLRDTDRQDVQASILTINEVRESRGLPPVAWGDEPTSGGQLDPLTGLPMADPNAQPPAPESYIKRYNPQLDLDFVSRGFGQHLDNYSVVFARVQSRLFKRQAAEVSKLIVEGIPPNSAFHVKDWAELYKREGGPVYQRVLLSAAQQATGQFNLFGKQAIAQVPAFSITAPSVAKWLETRIRLWATLVNEETGRLITGEIQEANALGESIPQIQARLEKVFKFNDSVRTERIARTEMLSTANQGRLEAYEQSGVVGQIRWLTARDDRVRDSHAAADGQTVTLGEPFTVGGALLDAPGVGHGGTIAPAAETVQCRCVTVPILAQKGVVIDRPTLRA